ncbi:pentapeptide repeat-containing protein [Adonisia turfae]
MKAAELLGRYRAGQRDFSGQSLRGENFRGQNLSGAVFTNADIRGANFAYANLTATNFSYAQAGLQKRWSFGLAITSLLLSIFSGFVSGCLGLLSTSAVNIHSASSQTLGLFILISIGIFSYMLVHQGIRGSLINVSTSTLALLIAYATAFLLLIALAETTTANTVSTLFMVLMGLVTLVGILMLTLVGSINTVLAITISNTAAIFPNTIGAFVVAIATVILTFRPLAPTPFVITSLILGIAVALSLVRLSIHIGWRAWHGDQRDTWIRSTAFRLATIGGTSFRRSKLTEAIFSNAILKGTDLRQALVRRTCWRNAKMLEQARSEDTYLNNAIVLQLVVHGNGQEQSYQGMNLSGINLDQANLFRANFAGANLQQSSLKKTNLASANLIGTNLNQANLQGANLANAKLVRAQLEQANLTDTTLTGAYLENWRIDRGTKLGNICCDYVFMHLPAHNSSSESRYRKPDNWHQVFAEGEFASFIVPLPRTLDLYHTGVVDVCVVAIALHALKVQHPDADLNIVAMEQRGNNCQQLLVRVSVSQQSDLSALHEHYFKQYENLLTLSPQAIHEMLIKTDKDIQLLAGFISPSAINSDM